MNATSDLPSLQEEIAARLRAFPALRRSFRLGARERANVLADVLKAPEVAEGTLPSELSAPAPVRNPARELAGLEDRTESFRVGLARGHVARIRQLNQARSLALEEWTDVAAGLAPSMPCKNEKWRPGAKAPAPKHRRCLAERKGDRCALLLGHTGPHEIDRSRVNARALLRECSGVVRVAVRGPRVQGKRSREIVWRESPCLRLHGHKGKCKAKRPPKWKRACPCALCTLHESVTSEQWHEGRDRGQRRRFDHVRSCGSRMMIASCGVCGTDRKPLPEGCGVRRVCPKCDALGAIARRARFGRARGRAFVAGHRYGLARRNRHGGRYTEKMLTLTVPHALLANAGGIVRAKSRDDLHARVVALHEAWPRFLRKVNRHWQERGETHVDYHRAFEWTPGRSDEHGHPHYHVYLWCPFVDARILASWWAESLREVGWPVGVDENGFPRVRTKLQMLRQMNVSAVRELMKGGKRQALTLSRLDFATREQGAEFRRGNPRGSGLVGPGIDAFKYAEGWTLGDVEECSEDVRARLYMALEGRRLTQASRGFFLDDSPVQCECCSATRFRVRFESAPVVALQAPEAHPRGPP